MSYSAEVTDIISIAQHARPMVSGHTLELCAQRTTSSSLAKKNCPGPISICLTGASALRAARPPSAEPPGSPGLRPSVLFGQNDSKESLSPFKAALLPHVRVPNREHDDEN